MALCKSPLPLTALFSKHLFRINFTVGPCLRFSWGLDNTVFGVALDWKVFSNTMLSRKHLCCCFNYNYCVINLMWRPRFLCIMNGTNLVQGSYCSFFRTSSSVLVNKSRSHWKVRDRIVQVVFKRKDEIFLGNSYRLMWIIYSYIAFHSFIVYLFMFVFLN